MSPVRRPGLWLGAVLTLAVFAGGVASGGAGWLACDENLQAGTTRAHVCSVVGTDHSFLLLSIAPALVLMVAAAVAPRRLTAALAALALIGEGIVLAVILRFAL
jgi:cytochrome b